MPSYKLYYLFFKGLGEPIRLLFSYVNQPFEDVRLESFEAVAKLGDELPYKKVPVLVIDGKERIAQQQAILRYLGKQFNLAGKDDLEAAHIDALGNLLTDFHIAIRPFIRVVAGYEQGDLPKLVAEYVVPGIQQFLPFYEKALAQSNSGYLAKSGLTWIDFCICEQTLWMKSSLPDLVKQFPLLLAHADRIYALPTLQDYLKNRPQASV